ncbi:MAG: PIN domain-containing protein [Acidimicrobiia bacterium]
MNGLADIGFGSYPLPLVMFDANVLFQAAVTRFLLGAAQSGTCRVVWTEEIAEETCRNLMAAGRPGALIAFEQNGRLVFDPVVPASSRSWAGRLLRTDPKDRHVLAAAGRNKVQVLVTDNVRDFDREEVRELDIVIATSREFAAHIAERFPLALVRHIERVPPERFSRYVALLERQLPEAMALLASYLRD